MRTTAVSLSNGCMAHVARLRVVSLVLLVSCSGVQILSLVESQ